MLNLVVQIVTTVRYTGVQKVNCVLNKKRLIVDLKRNDYFNKIGNLLVPSIKHSACLQKRKIFQFYGSVHHISINENTNLMQQS